MGIRIQNQLYSRNGLFAINLDCFAQIKAPSISGTAIVTYPTSWSISDQEVLLIPTCPLKPDSRKCWNNGQSSGHLPSPPSLSPDHLNRRRHFPFPVDANRYRRNPSQNLSASRKYRASRPSPIGMPVRRSYMRSRADMPVPFAYNNRIFRIIPGSSQRR